MEGLYPAPGVGASIILLEVFRVAGYHLQGFMGATNGACG